MAAAAGGNCGKKQGHSEFPVVEGGCQERTSPEARGPAEARPGRKAETDRVCEGISEGVPPDRAREGHAKWCGKEKDVRHRSAEASRGIRELSHEHGLHAQGS